MICLAICYRTHNGAVHVFHFVDRVLRLPRKSLVIAMVFVSLLPRLACSATPVITVALRLHNWVKLMVTFLLW